MTRKHSRWRFSTILPSPPSTRIPLAAAVLKALGVITSREIKTTDPGGRDLDYTRIEFKWEVLGDFVGNNGKWAKDVYGWGQNFDYNKAINNLILVIQASHLALARKRTMTAAEAAVFLKNGGGRKIAEAAIPFIQNTLQKIEGDGTPLFSNEAGLKVECLFGDVGVPASWDWRSLLHRWTCDRTPGPRARLPST